MCLSALVCNCIAVYLVPGLETLTKILHFVVACCVEESFTQKKISEVKFMLQVFQDKSKSCVSFKYRKDTLMGIKRQSKTC